MATATRVAGDEEGDGESDKSDGDGDEEGDGDGGKSDGDGDEEGEGEGGKSDGDGDKEGDRDHDATIAADSPTHPRHGRAMPRLTGGTLRSGERKKKHYIL